jgi:hypothetical protein
MRKHLTTILMLAALLVIFSAVAVCAADSGGYKYKVKVYPGEQGTFNGSSEPVVMEFSFGELCAINLSDLGFKPKNDSKYYVRGFRITGHDNDESTGFTNPTFNVTEDVSYEIAYGIKGDLVAYKIRYEDKDGNTLHESDTYYGMVGDKPVVSYRYVEGFIPEAYNLRKTLGSDEKENVFTFVYNKVNTEEQVQDEDQGNDNTGAPRTQTGNRRTVRAAAPGTTANPAGTNAAGVTDGNGNDGDNGDGGDEGETIDDNETPLSDGEPDQFVDIDDNKTPKSSFSSKLQNPLVKAGIALAGLVVIALIVFFLVRRRRNKETDNIQEDVV